MSLALVAALAAAPSSLSTCSWDRPGHNAFMGDVVAAVDRYQDIPAATRAKLKARMAARQYDEIVSIRRDSIEGQARYGSDIRDMHFGLGQTCGTVSRAAWAPDLQERGLVYCEDGQCILVPTVCRNVSRISRSGPAAGPALAGAGPAGGGGGGGGAGGAGGAGSGDGPGAVAALPEAGLGGLPAGQNAPDSFAKSAGIGSAGGATGAGGAGSGGAAAADGASIAGGAAGGSAGAAGAGTELAGSALGGAPGGLWTGVGVGTLLAGLSGGSGAADGGSGASGSGPSGSGTATGGSSGAGGLPAGSTSGGTASGIGSGAASDGSLLPGGAALGDVLSGLVPPAPAPAGVFLPGTGLPDTVLVPEAQTAWMMALGAALLLAWRRRSARPLV